MSAIGLEQVQFGCLVSCLIGYITPGLFQTVAAGTIQYINVNTFNLCLCGDKLDSL